MNKLLFQISIVCSFAPTFGMYHFNNFSTFQSSYNNPAYAQQRKFLLENMTWRNVHAIVGVFGGIAGLIGVAPISLPMLQSLFPQEIISAPLITTGIIMAALGGLTAYSTPKFFNSLKETLEKRNQMSPVRVHVRLFAAPVAIISLGAGLFAWIESGKILGILTRKSLDIFCEVLATMRLNPFKA